MKKLVTVEDFGAKDIQAVFRLAERMKKNPKKFHTALQGQKFGLIFEKPSTRTWVSFDAGIDSLGGSTIYLGPQDIQLGQREEVRDVARVLDRYLAGVILRTFRHDTITEFGKYFKRPVINGLSDVEHPCQAMADYLTIREKFGPKAKPTLTFVGDGNNVLSSLLLLAAILGLPIRYATPKNHEPDPKIVRKAKRLAKKSGGSIAGFHDPVEAVKGTDVVYTDVWVSMGEEKIRSKKLKAFKGMQVNEKLMKHANKKAIVMHCLPAHRGEEITDKLIESKKSVVFDQAENRLHIQKAILLYLCSEG